MKVTGKLEYDYQSNGCPWMIDGRDLDHFLEKFQDQLVEIDIVPVEMTDAQDLLDSLDKMTEDDFTRETFEEFAEYAFLRRGTAKD